MWTRVGFACALVIGCARRDAARDAGAIKDAGHDAEPTVEEVDPSIAVDVNLHGYRPDEPKRVVVRTPFDCVGDGMLEVRPLDRQDPLRTFPVLCRGRITGEDGVAWDGYFSTADIDELTTPGAWQAVARIGGRRSRPVGITVDVNVYAGLLELWYRWFYYQRCGDAVGPPVADESWHQACHLDDGWLVADATNPAARMTPVPIDATGGWHDAGDYGKYVLTQPLGVYALLYAYEKNPAFWDAIDRDANGTADIIDEATWGGEWLVKMIDAYAGGATGMWEVTGAFWFSRSRRLNFHALAEVGPEAHTDGLPAPAFAQACYDQCVFCSTDCADEATCFGLCPDDRLVDRLVYGGNGQPARIRAGGLVTAAALALLARHYRSGGVCGGPCTRFRDRAINMYQVHKDLTSSFGGDDLFKLGTAAWGMIAAMEIEELLAIDLKGEVEAQARRLLDLGLGSDGNYASWIPDPDDPSKPYLAIQYYGVVPAALARYAQRYGANGAELGRVREYLDGFFGDFMAALSDNPYACARFYGRPRRSDAASTTFWFVPREDDQAVEGALPGQGRSTGLFELAWAAELAAEALDRPAYLELARHWIHFALGRNPLAISLVNAPGVATLPRFYSRLGALPVSAAYNYAPPGSIATGPGRAPADDPRAGDRPYMDLETEPWPDYASTEPWIATNAYAILAAAEGEW